MQANAQADLVEAIASPLARGLKIIFERSINMLRFGLIPVFVLDGMAPEAKEALMVKR